jgi:hypothetical protein
MASSPSRTLVLTLTAVTDKFSKGLGSADKSLTTFGEKLTNFGKKAGLALATIGVAAGALAIKIGKDAITAASDLSEELSKSTVLFGEGAAAIDEWAKTAGTALGQSRTQALRAAGNFAVFGKSAGLVDSELVDFSTDLTALASDLASFSNTTPEDAVQALGAALRGESEPIRRYGVLLDDQTLRQRALEMGIVDTTKNALTPQQRVLAAQAEIFAQTSAAQGDFARTSDGLANSQRILAANLEDVKTTIGEALLPVAEEFSAFLVRTLPDVIDFAREMGEKLAPAAKKFGDFVKETVLPAVRDVWPHVRDFALFVKDLVLNVTEFLREEIAPRFLNLVKDLFEPATNAWQSVSALAASVRALFTSLKLANPEGSILLDWLFKLEKFKWDYILERVDKLAKLLKAVVDAATRLSDFAGGRGQLSIPGGDFQMPPGFVPGQVLPNARSSSTTSTAPVVINVNGTLDSESAAREIRRILGDSNLRTGFQPIRAA